LGERLVTVLVYLFSVGAVWWDTSCTTASLSDSTDARRTRGDIRGVAAHHSARSLARLLGCSASFTDNDSAFLLAMGLLFGSSFVVYLIMRKLGIFRN
jgi:hypothetical protein